MLLPRVTLDRTASLVAAGEGDGGQVPSSALEGRAQRRRPISTVHAAMHL